MKIYGLLWKAVGLCLLVLCCFNAIADELTAYVYDSFPVEIQTMLQEQMKTNNIDLQFRTFSSSEMAITAVLQEGEKTNADVIVGIDNYLPIDNPIFEQLKPLSESFHHPLESFVRFDERLLPYDWGYICFNYDSHHLKNAPQTLNDLIKKDYTKSIILENPESSSVGRAFLIFTAEHFQDEKKFVHFWKQMAPNIFTVTPGWSDAYFGIYAKEEAPIVLSYSSSPVYHKMFEDSERYQNMILDDTAPLQIEAAAILKTSSHPKEAEQFLQLLTSKEIQAMMPKYQLMFPARKGLELPEAYRMIPEVSHKYVPDREKIAREFPHLLELWMSAVQ